MQKHVETMDHKMRRLETEHEKALKTIQGFLEKQQQLESTTLRKEQKIMELEIELNRLRECENSKVGRDRHNQYVRRDFSTDMTDDPERDPSNQVDIIIFRLCSAISTFLNGHILTAIYFLGSRLGAVVLRFSSFFVNS